MNKPISSALAAMLSRASYDEDSERSEDYEDLTNTAQIRKKPSEELSPLQRMLSRNSSSEIKSIAASKTANVKPWVPRKEADESNKKSPPETLEGHVQTVQMYGEWGIAKVWISKPEQQEIRVTGSAVSQLKEGMDYSFLGSWQTTAKYGKRFDLEVAHPQIHPHPGAIAKFIESNFDGVGPKTAARYVKKVMEEGGDEALDTLRRQLVAEPWLVDLSSVMRKGREANFAGEHKQVALAAFVHRELALRIGSIDGMRDNVLKGLSVWLAGQIERDQQRRSVADRQEASAQGIPYVPQTGIDMKERAWALLCADPYKAIGEVPGYGFLTADKIGAQASIEFDSPLRLGALVSYAQLEMSERAGHVFLTRDQLMSTIKRIDARVDVDAAVEHACAMGTIVKDAVDIEPTSEEGSVASERYYHPRMLKAEKSLARRLAQLAEPGVALAPQPQKTRFKTVNEQVVADTPEQQRLAYEESLRSRIREVAKPIFPAGLDKSQEEALFSLLSSRSRLHTLTAGPGCGKTAMMEVLVRLLSDKRFHFCAPTGKASKVLTARLQGLGQSCATIHSLLQGSGPGDFRVDAQNPLYGDVLVVDESSMPDLELTNALLAAVPNEMHVIFLGDTRQLPSIAPGQVLSDVLKINGADHNRLTKTHRNSGGILDVVNEIGAGNLNTTDRESVVFSHGLGDASLEFSGVMSAYIGSAARVGIERAVLIMPRRQGDAEAPGWNTTYANAVLRQVMNPNAPKITGTSFCTGDRIIIRANMAIPQPTQEELQAGKAAVDDGDGDDEDTSRAVARVVNGDTGTIKGWVPAPKGSRQALPQWLTVDLDDGQRIQMPGAAVADMGLAYALTVHAAQGSEYKEVIMVVTPGVPGFMNRNMIFTGASRARDRLSIFGEDRVLQQVAKTPLPARNSALAQRVAYVMHHEDDADQCIDAADEPIQADQGDAVLETANRQRYG